VAVRLDNLDTKGKFDFGLLEEFQYHDDHDDHDDDDDVHLNVHDDVDN